MPARRAALSRMFARSTVMATVVLIGACSSSGSGYYNPYKSIDSRYEREQQRQRGEEPARNPSHIEERRRGGQDSSHATPPGVPGVTPRALPVLRETFRA